MKKNKKFILPVAVLLIGAGGALATSTKTTAESLVENGYHYDSLNKECIMTTQNCTDLPGPACTWGIGGPVLYRFSNPTTCGVELKRL